MTDDEVNHVDADPGGVCDNCGAPNPKTRTAAGRFCDEACADAFDLM